MKQNRILNLQKKSKRSLAVAKELHAKGDYDFAISRAYYALFYIAEALLLMKEKNYSSHSAVLSGFFENYVQSGLVQRKYHSILREAFDLRDKADYGWDHIPSKDISQRVLHNCEEFLQATAMFFKEGV